MNAVSYITAPAQRAAIAAVGGVLLAEFLETDQQRKPKLAEAIEYANENKATLVFGEVGKLARNPRAVMRLIEKRVPVAFADAPDINITMLMYHAIVADRLAKPSPTGQARAAQNRTDALERLEPLRDRLTGLRESGLSIRRIAQTLNAEGIASPGGGKWHPASVHKALGRL